MCIHCHSKDCSSTGNIIYYNIPTIWASLVTQTVKNPPAMWVT